MWHHRKPEWHHVSVRRLDDVGRDGRLDEQVAAGAGGHSVLADNLPTNGADP